MNFSTVIQRLIPKYFVLIFKHIGLDFQMFCNFLWKVSCDSNKYNFENQKQSADNF